MLTAERESRVEPAFLWSPPSTHTRGGEVADLAASAGFAPDAEQRLVLDIMFATRGAGRWAARTVVVVAPRQNLKALAWDTPMMTGRGWLPMSDVQVGDEVFHPSGHPVTVTHVSDVKLGHTCYRVETTDGRSVVADAGHLWTVRDARLDRWVTLTTQDFVDSGLDRGKPRTVQTDGVVYATREYRWQLPTQEPVKSPDVELPIDPYLFGAWLGDGKSGGAALFAHGDDVPHWVAEIERCGYIPTVTVKRTCTDIGITSERGKGLQSRSLVGKLRNLGVLGGKHVPDLYLSAGTGQREALLQGLLDTDGTISAAGQVSFCSTRCELADAVAVLARSLGWRANINESRAKLDGRDCGPQFNVTFTPKSHDPFAPFRLPRKAARVRDGEVRRGRFTISIRSIDPVSSVPVMCIKVDSPDGLFLAGRGLIPTHNTGVLKMAALDDLFLAEPDLNLWTAHRYDASQEAFNEIKAMVTNSDHLRKRVAKVSSSKGDEEITSTTGARLKFLARSLGSGRAMSGRVIYYDEAYALTPGHIGASVPVLATRDRAQVRAGSSAGHSTSAVLRGWRDLGRKGGARSLAYLEWCARSLRCASDVCEHEIGAQGCCYDDPAVWLEANSALGRRITEDSIRGERELMDPDEFARERLGVWDEPAAEGTDLPLSTWAALGNPDAVPSGRLVVGADVAPGHASSSVYVFGSGAIPVGELVVRANGSSWLVDRLASMVARHDVAAVAVDPSGPIGSLVPAMQAANLPLALVEGKESVRACGSFAASAADGQFRHRAEPEMAAAVAGARRRSVGDAWKWSRKDSTVDITGLVAATNALWAQRSAPSGQPEIHFL